jgi:PGM1 C-terminal domain
MTFAELQHRMVAVHAATRAGRGGRSIVIVPSRTIDKWHEPAAETQAYEERLLCLLLMLRDPGLSVVYVTSSPIAPAIVDYYMSLLPRPLRASARARLTLLSARDRSTRPLAAKLLERPRLLTRIRWSIPNRSLCHLVPYTTTALERELALELDIPMYGADPRHADYGTKSGCRELFALAGVPHPLGVERIAGVPEAIAAIERLRAVKPELTQLVMKLDEGVSGEGNAIVDLVGLPRPGADDERQRIGERLHAMALEAPGVSVADYLTKLAARGGIVEERITGREVRSPSVQLRITPASEVEIVSTHDQLLGGHSGQSYLGCRFPAEPSYAPAITELAARVGRRLAAAGVIGRSAIDFVVVLDDRGRWHPYAIELNLRKGGTTHPFAALEQLTGGAYHAETASFATPVGAHKHYVASDHVESPLLRRLGHRGLLALLDGRRLGFDRARQHGVVFHMLSSLDRLGRLGLTAVANSPADAQRRFDDARATLLEAAAYRPVAAAA